MALVWRSCSFLLPFLHFFHSNLPVEQFVWETSCSTKKVRNASMIKKSTTHPGCTKAFKNLSSLSNNIAPAVSGLFGKHKAVFTLPHHPNFFSKPSRRKNIQTPHHGYASDSPVREDITLCCPVCSARSPGSEESLLSTLCALPAVGRPCGLSTVISTRVDPK